MRSTTTTPARRVGCHSTAPVLPAVLAVAEELGAKAAKDLITAFVVGVEIEGRINYMPWDADHYPRGWHTTATYGTFGATAGVAHLLKLHARCSTPPRWGSPHLMPAA